MCAHCKRIGACVVSLVILLGCDEVRDAGSRERDELQERIVRVQDYFDYSLPIEYYYLPTRHIVATGEPVVCIRLDPDDERYIGLKQVLKYGDFWVPREAEPWLRTMLDKSAPDEQRSILVQRQKKRRIKLVCDDAGFVSLETGGQQALPVCRRYPSLYAILSLLREPTKDTTEAPCHKSTCLLPRAQ